MATAPIFVRCFYIGINIENILYGIELALYFKTISVLLGNSGAHKKTKLFYALFSSAMVSLITVRITTQAIFGQNMWLLNPNYPGGQGKYWMDNVGVWYMNLAMISVSVLQLMTEAFMIHRCWIMSNSRRVVIAPIALWLVALTLGVLVTWTNSFHGCNHCMSLAAHFTLAYWSISAFLNATLTCMLCYHILQRSKRIQKIPGREYASFCSTIIAIVIESVLPFVLTGIASLMALAVSSPISTVFGSVHFPMMCISPQMLILRVVEGKAWGGDTFSQPDLVVGSGPPGNSGSGSQWSDGSGAEYYAGMMLDRFPV